MAGVSRTAAFVAALMLLAAPAWAQSSGFGTALVVGDGELIVGEPSNNFRPGAVYIYRKSGSEWRPAVTLASPNSERADNFGSTVALGVNTLFVGQRGTIHVFRKVGNAWQHSGTIQPPEGATQERFGAALAAAGDWLFVGAPGVAQGGGRGGRGGANAPTPTPGSIHVYRRGANNQWTQHARITAPEPAAGDGFGSAVAMVDGRALAGAPGANERAGVVHALGFDPATNAWSARGSLQAAGLQANEGFGTTLALNGGVAVVGTPAGAGGYGAAYVFRHSAQNDEWTESARLVAFDGRRQDRFGHAVALDGTEIWIGAPAPGGGTGNGNTYSFRAEGASSTFSGARVVRATNTDVHDRFGQAVAMRGGVAAVAALGDDHGAGTVFVYERDASGNWREQQVLASAPDALEGLTGRERKCEGGKVGVFACGEAELLAFVPVNQLAIDGRGVRLNDIWGWTDPRTGREYALVGRIEGTSFVDITDPSNPRLIGELPKTAGSPDGTWRDIKVYKDHAFIVADASGRHGMQVFDLTQLRNARNTPVRYTPAAHYTRINSAHNIVINEATGFAYSVGSSSGGETCGGGLHMIDIRDPKNPTFAGCFADPQTGRAGTGYSHDAQCVLYNGPDERYRNREICLGSNENALSIADVTDKATPKAISRASYPNPGYTHQGWLTDDHRYFYMDDEGDELAGSVDRTRTLVWDLSDLEDPKLALEFLGTTSASDHNLYVKGNLMYQSNYRAGLRIIDISDPLKPVEVGYFDTAPYLADAPGFNGTWSNYPFFKSGTIAVSSVGEGLFLVKKRDQKAVL